jgi:hypothetical protein
MTNREPLRKMLSDLLWVAPASTIIGLLLTFISPGLWWMGWIAFSAITIIGIFTLLTLWRWAGGARALIWLISVAFLLRISTGAALTLLLPTAGYDNAEQTAGYVFYDAYRRDTQSWDLARSVEPLWRAFDKSYSTDQYGGLLALSALVYRYLSPGAQRPLLIILLAALVAAAGIPFLWKAARQIWSEPVALCAGWILALYPEGVLQGASQMREPFLITFITIAFWGLIEWQSLQRRQGLGWITVGFAGMLLFSPGIALLTLAIFAGWLWFSREHSRLSWQVIIIALAILVFALALFVWGTTRQVNLAHSLNLKQVTSWFNEVMHWDTLEAKRSSGWLQKIFGEMDKGWRIPFITVYGIAQPVLPAALIEPTVPIWRVIGLLRALGWYVFVPFLLFGFVAAWKTPDKQQRRLWLWIAAAVWLWIIISAARAGGDQWDNPSYRVILLPFQALLFSHAWTYWRTRHSPWLGRIMVMEGIFLTFFTEWYINRYYGLLFKMPFFTMVAIILSLSILFALGSLGWDYRHSRHAERP